MARQNRYNFASYDQKLDVFVFMVVFMSYWPEFWGFGAICMARKTQYMFMSYDQKLVVFAFYGHFHELFPTVLGFQGNLHGS